MGTVYPPCRQTDGAGGNRCVEALCAEPASRNASEPVPASLHQLGVASLPKMLKPVTRHEEIFASNVAALRGDSGQRAGKAELGRLGDPFDCLERGKGRRESITAALVEGKSDEPIVALRRGNARGAKGLWFKRSGLRREAS